MIEPLIALLAPHECISCSAEGRLLCAVCISAMPAVLPRCYRCEQPSAAHKTCKNCRRTSALRSVTPFTAYEGLAKELVWRLKFGRAKAAAHDIARQLSAPLSHAHQTVVVPVPTATSRIRRRGYDQACLIAKSFARIHSVPFAYALLRTDQHRQVGASGEMRRKQLRTSFRTSHRVSVTDKHIILIDDVVTSGATLEAAAATLRLAGAWRIDACVFARAGMSLRS